MINTYKKEFTVAKWSEVKDILHFECINKWKTEGFLMYKGEFANFLCDSAIKRDFDKIREFMEINNIDFINFDE